jgi:hypothetical protein
MEKSQMKPTLSSLVARITLSLFALTLLTSISAAQADVEIEVAGPWSYVQDPSDSTRVILVAPNDIHVPHVMNVFMGDNAMNPAGLNQLAGRIHKLDFPLAPCVHQTSTPPLYSVSGVTRKIIKRAIKSPSSYVISLPKPCSYQTKDDMVTRFTYKSTGPVGSGDPESKLTMWMALLYKVAPTTTSAILDNQNLAIPFGSNNGTSTQAISIILNVPKSIYPDTKCDWHSRHIFYLTETMWEVPHVYRAFPGLAVDNATNTNTQTSYNYECEQIQDPIPTLGISSPGRADCHAPQVNVNAIVQ